MKMQKKKNLTSRFSGVLTLLLLLLSGPQLFGQIPEEDDLNIPTTTSVSTCAGTAATVTASDGGDDVSEYKWYTAQSGGNYIDSGTSLTQTVSITTIYWVESVSTSGSTSPDRAQATITVNPLANATVLSSSTLAVCPGEAATINVSGGSSYRWYSSSSATTPITGSPTGSGSDSYSPTVSAASTEFYVAAVNAGNCEEPAASRTKVTVTTTPVVKPVIVVSEGACSGSNNFEISATNYNASLSYEIFKDGNDTALSITPTVENGNLVWAVVGTGDYKVKATSTGGCWNESDDLQVVHFSLPNKPLLNDASNASVLENCVGSNVTIAVTSSASTTKYRWRNLGTGADTFTNKADSGGDRITYSAVSGNTNYRVYAINGNNCESTEYLAVTTVGVAIPGTPAIQGAASTLAVCDNGTATMVVSVSGADSYRWYSSNSATTPISGSPTTGTYSVTVTQATKDYYVEALNSLDCESPVRRKVTVTISPLANATVLSSSTLAVCPGEAATINVSGGSSYRWYSSSSATTPITGSPTGSGSDSYSPTVSAASTDFYVAAVNAGNCEEPAASRTKVTVTTTPVVKPVIVVSEGACSGSNNFEISATNYNASLSYEIFKDGNDTALNLTPTVENGNLVWAVVGTGTYKVKATSTGGCWNESDDLQVVHFSLPNAPLLNNAITTTVEGCVGSSIPLGVTGASSYRWVNANTGDNVVDGSNNVITTNQINVDLASGTQDYHVYTSNANGCESTDYLVISVEGVDIPGKPTIANPNDLSLCESATVSVEVSGSHTYNWIGLPSGATFNADKSIATFTAVTGSNTYQVEGVNRLGCAGLSSDKRSFTIVTAPEVIKPIIELTSNSCEGENEFVITLTNEQANVTYEIFKDGDDTNVHVAPRTAGGVVWDVTSAGAYYVKGTSTSVCQDWDKSLDLVVTPFTRPNAPLLNNAITTTVEGCVGSSIPLGVTGASSFRWVNANTGDNVVDGSNNVITTNQINVDLASGTQDYHVYTSNANGCESTEYLVVTTVGVDIPGKPGIVNPNDLSLCESATVSVEVSGSHTYNWIGLPAGATFNADKSIATFTAVTGSNTYQVEGVNRLGCAGISSDKRSFTIVTAPEVIKPIIELTSNSCEGENEFVITLLNEQDDVTYEIFKDGDDAVHVAPRTPGGVVWDVTSAGIYHVKGTSTSVCQDWDKSLDLVVTPYTRPNAPLLNNAITTTVEGCVGTSIPLGVTGGSSFRWVNANTGDDVVDGSNNVITTNQINVDLASGTQDYHVYTSNANGCESTEYLVVTTVGVDIPGKPGIVNPNDLSLCESATVSVEVSGSYTYNWIGLPAGATFNADKSIATFTAVTGSNTYQVEGVNRLGCAGLSSDKRSFTIVTAPEVIKPIIELTSNSCEGENEFVITLLNEQDDVTYEIFKDGDDAVHVAPRTPGGVVWDVTSAGIYHVEGTSTSVCQDWDESLDLVVTPYTRPNAPLLNNAIATTLEGCVGTSIPLAVTGGSSYRWVNANTGDDVVDGSNNVITTNQINVDLASGTQDYHVYVSNANGCESTAYLTISVEGYDLPETPVYASEVDICHDVSATTLTLTEITGGGYYAVYTAAQAGSLIDTDVTALNVPINSENTIVYIERVSADGCPSPQRAQVNISKYIEPTPYELSDAGETSYCETTELTLSNSQEGVIYTLFRDGEAVATQPGDDSELIWVAIDEGGTYSITASVEGCASIPMLNEVTIAVEHVNAYATSGGGIVCFIDGGQIAINGSQDGIEYYLKKDGEMDFSSKKIGTGRKLVWLNLRESGTYTVVADGPTCGYRDMSYPQQLTVKPAPAAPVVEDQVVYQSGASAMLQVSNVAEGVVINWYSLAGVLLHTGTSYSITGITASVCVQVEAVLDDCASERVNANVIFTLATPPLTPALIEPCGQEYLRATGDIPEGVTWYWQGQNADGKDMTLDASLYDFRLLKSGIYYIRGYDNVNQVWGTEIAQKSVTLTEADRNTPVDCDEVRTVVARTAPEEYATGEFYNQVKTYSAMKAYQDVDDVLDPDNKENVTLTTEFFDGLGRPIQIVNRAGSPAEKDMVQILSYDEHGRQAYQYLPFTSTESDGDMKIDPYADQLKFYKGDTESNIQGLFPDQSVFYGRTSFEESPLNRSRLTTTAGDSWEGSGVGIKHDYEINTESDGVRIWQLDASGTFVTDVTNVYGNGELRVLISTDENGNLMKTYTDKSGREILMKRQLADNVGEGHTGWLSTYNIYNDYGDLVFVVPPKAVEILAALDWDIDANIEPIAELAFQYRYDNKGRMISRELPGGSREDRVYDKLDRLIATQNGNQRGGEHPHWIFTKFDALNRPVIVGAYHGDETRNQLQSLLDGNTFSTSLTSVIPSNPEIYEGVNLKLGRHESGITTYKARQRVELLPGFNSGEDQIQVLLNENLSIDNKEGYNDGTFPLDGENVELYEVIYYDDYRFTQKTFDENFPAFTTTDNSIEPAKYDFPLGNQTGSRKRILGTDQWLESALFYDDRGRIIQKREGNQHGGEKIETRQYDFSGKLLQTHVQSTNPEAGEDNSALKKYEYDNVGRVTLSQHEINASGDLKTVGTYTYDELGQMKSRIVGDNLENLDYTYNIKGWLKGINADELEHDAIINDNFFAMELSYEQGFAKHDRSGNIMGVKWKTNTRPEMLAYGYDYDRVDRIIKADYAQGQSWGNEVADYGVSDISYDVNGNILSLTRQGMIGGVKTQIDNLHYTYKANSPNQLLKVVDRGLLDESDPFIVLQDPSAEGFANRNGDDDDYIYDSNGNLISDENKGIASINYNFMNLPEYVVMDTHEDITKTVTFLYDVRGNKLSEVTNDNGEITKIDYTDGYTYQNNELKMLSHDEGRVRKTGNGFIYDYYLKDHLGKTRVTLTEGHTEYIYLATMETDTDPVEEVDLETYEKEIFLNMDASRVVYNNANYTVDLDINTNEVSILNGTVANRRIGPGKIINVFPGDEVEIEVFAYYEGDLSGPSTGVSPVEVAAAAATAFGGVLGGTLEQQFIHEGFNTNPLAIAVGDAAASSTNPRAYLNYVLFDDNFEFIDAGFMQVTNEAKGNHEVLKLSRAVVTGGYLYVYVSNETNEDFEVYFDDLRIRHKKGIIVGESHYYPFGASIKSLSYSDGSLEGIPETDKLGLGWSDLGFRNFDPALARFFSVDPRGELAPGVSTYHYASNNPIKSIDYLGLFSFPSLIGIGNMLQGLKDFWHNGEVTTQIGVVVVSGGDDYDDDDDDDDDDEQESGDEDPNNSPFANIIFRHMQWYQGKYIPTKEGKDFMDQLGAGKIDHVPQEYRKEWQRRAITASDRALNPDGYTGARYERHVRQFPVKSDNTTNPYRIRPQLEEIEKKSADGQKSSSGSSAADRYINEKVMGGQQPNNVIVLPGSTYLNQEIPGKPGGPEDPTPEETQLDEDFDQEAEDGVELVDLIMGLNNIAFMQGFLGRLVDDLTGLYEMQQYLEASSLQSHLDCYAGSDQEESPYCQNIFKLRLEMLELTVFLNQLYRSQVLRDYLFEQIMMGLEEYMEDIDDLSWDGQVKRGALGYDILMAWLPPEKFLKMIKGMRLGTALVKTTKAIPNSLKTTLSKLEKKGIHAKPTSVDGVQKLVNKDGKEVAKITTKGDGPNDVEIEITDETIKSKLTGDNLDELNKAINGNDDLLAAIANDTDGSTTKAFDNAVNAGVDEKLRNNPEVLDQFKGFDSCN